MAISNILNQPQYYQGLDLNSLANGKKPNMTSAITGKPAVGVISTTPKSTVSSSTKPSAAPSPSSSMGTYKGVSITPGTDAQIQAQMRSIDNPAPTRGLFPSVSSSLSSSITTPRTLKTREEENKPATYPSILEDLIGRATNSDAITKATQDLTAFRQGTSQKIADIKSQAVPLEFQQGRAQVVQQASAEKERALEQGVQNLVTARGQDINALTSAAELAKPSVAAYGQTVFNPLTGQYESSGGGNLDPQIQASTFAQQIINKGMTYDQAIASMGYAGAAGKTFLDNAIIAAGGNPLQLQAQGAASQSNIGTQNTAQTDIARQGLSEATQSYVTMNAAAQFAGQQATAVSSILNRTGLNNVSSTDYNKALNNIKGRFSDTDFAALNTALREAQIAYTNLLSTGGGTPSGREEQAINTLNINQSSSAINASIGELENAVARRLQAQYGAMQQYQQNLGGGNQSSTVGGGTVKVGNYTYQLVNGKYVLAQ